MKLLKIKSECYLDHNNLLELAGIMENQETSDREIDTTCVYDDEFGKYEIEFDEDGDGVLISIKN